MIILILKKKFKSVHLFIDKQILPVSLRCAAQRVACCCTFKTLYALQNPTDYMQKD